MLPETTLHLESLTVVHDLRGRVAVVTGGGGDIGCAIAQRLAVEGARVYVNDIDAERAGRVAAQIRADNGDAVAVAGDMGSEEAVARLFETVAAATDSQLDILVTQAGVVSSQEYIHPPDDLSIDEWSAQLAEDGTLAMGCYLQPDDLEFMLRNDLHSSFYCAQAAVPLMKAAGRGHIITMSAAGGGISSHFSPPYGIAKGAIVGLTRAMARALLPDNILVNCISQGFIDAGLWRKVPHAYPKIWERDWELVMEGSARTVRATPSNRLPLQRLGRPEEVASLVAFLVSGEGSYLVGQNFNLSGGVLIP